MRRAWLSIACASLGCGPRVEPPSAGGESTSASATSVDGPTTGTSTSTSSSTSSSTSTSSSSSASADTSSDSFQFIVESDWSSEIECDVWAQDCPRGEKCMPWANDGSSFWNATRCSPIADDPGAPGDPCTVEGSPVSGIDDCEIDAICWHVDSETNIGVCIPFCTGSAANPSCESACDRCNLDSSGDVLILCLPSCDPLLQDCNAGEACYPIGEGFGCGYDASGDAGALGDACEFINVCDPGLFCSAPRLVPGCESEGCCAPFCDAAAAIDTCDALLPGTECVPWYQQGGADDGCAIGTIGACLIAR